MYTHSVWVTKKVDKKINVAILILPLVIWMTTQSANIYRFHSVTSALQHWGQKKWYNWSLMLKFFLSYETFKPPRNPFPLSHSCLTVYTYLLFTCLSMQFNSCPYFSNYTLTPQNLPLQQTSNGREIRENFLRESFWGEKEKTHHVYSCIYVRLYLLVKWSDSKKIQENPYNNLVFLFLFRKMKICFLGSVFPYSTNYWTQ